MPPKLAAPLPMTPTLAARFQPSHVGTRSLSAPKHIKPGRRFHFRWPRHGTPPSPETNRSTTPPTRPERPTTEHHPVGRHPGRPRPRGRRITGSAAQSSPKSLTPESVRFATKRWSPQESRYPSHTFHRALRAATNCAPTHGMPSAPARHPADSLDHCGSRRSRPLRHSPGPGPRPERNRRRISTEPDRVPQSPPATGYCLPIPPERRTSRQSPHNGTVSR